MPGRRRGPGATGQSLEWMEVTVSWEVSTMLKDAGYPLTEGDCHCLLWPTQRPARPASAGERCRGQCGLGGLPLEAAQDPGPEPGPRSKPAPWKIGISSNDFPSVIQILRAQHRCSEETDLRSGRSP